MTPTVLPDPTADLHWSSFKGAIQDIFAQNAEKHPHRICVVETASSTTSERQFTYRQIHESSNVLAHHLLQHGISRGDVVMIYAYRGVDLVVSILGVLKAGAAFSVVDPAYPPARQQIYLDVARPRALIIINKASRENGDLSVDVRTWITQNLDLRTEIFGFELLDNGKLQGGSKNGVDILQEQQSLKSKHPGVVVGPDTQPTLSFTSGSEGIPKGCKGRHFSLTYYTAWMAERFGLSENDRFTMLSGIAHDPIQRDIFTPIFLGAQLYVPARNDIAHERLAEWMRDYEATVTHLTPAMGQILVGGASAELPFLKNAFFVGDVLIKRDCRLLSLLAPNVRIKNMFGTTETQRAVSYFEIPARNEDPDFLEQMGDVIPAGRGMVDVQLLVVDRSSLAEKKPRLCGIGEIGEIFVRAGGLAEGYLGSDELNREKFIDNFFPHPDWGKADKLVLRQGPVEPWRAFWKGPRDRLYKSGDLGRYRESGDVECTGRADSQVKIRGFRIELGEIDTHLSHHPLVRENLTIVRRDKDEEPHLVSYIVPDLDKWPGWLDEKGLLDRTGNETMSGMLTRFQALREDVRTYLRSKLPSYAVPNPVIPLSKFPLTPNYKVDKRALPYPDAAEFATAVSARRSARSLWSPTEKAVGEIWAQRIPGLTSDAIDLDDNFFDIGGHSMTGQEVLFDTRNALSVKLEMTTLFQNPTVRGFATALDTASRVENGVKTDIAPPETDYHLDGEGLRAKYLKNTISPRDTPPQAFLVTGATGFLGAHILANLLNRSPQFRVYAHVRASNIAEASDRVKNTCQAYGTWDEDWLGDGRLRFVTGDLSKPNLGVDTGVWETLEDTVDAVIHNGAKVHWVHTYSSLKAINIFSTLACISLCSTGRPKSLTFISSTAVLDTPSYLTSAVLESYDLSGSRKGLSTGYGQTKYVSEYLMREAGKLGLTGNIVRPGYITGDPDTGIGPTDDFLLRMLAGSIQLSCAPDLSPSTINMVPVSHCARIVVASSLHPPVAGGVRVVQVTPHPQLSFNTFLGTLSTYGYDVPIVPYAQWKSALERYVLPTNRSGKEGGEREPHALLPLFDWVTGDLPSETKSRSLSDTNAGAVLRADGAGDDRSVSSKVTEETIAVYLAFMVAIKFIPAPTESEGRPLPRVNISEKQKKILGSGGVGRGVGK